MERSKVPGHILGDDVCGDELGVWDTGLSLGLEAAQQKKLRGVMESELCNSEKNVDGGENVVVKKTLGDNF